MTIYTPGKVVLDSGNAPAAIAGVAPTLDYRFARDRREIETVSLTDKLTFTRSASCAYTDPAGNVAIAGANQPRFDHNSTSRESLGLLIEPSSTNAVEYSENLTAWGIPSSSLILSSPVNSTAYYVENASSPTVTLAAANPAVVSFYAKAGSSDWLFVRSVNWSSVPRIWFNVKIGAIGFKESAYIYDEQISPVNNGWYRISFKFNSPTDLKGLLQITACSGDLQISASGNVGVWGVQIEDAALSSYIQTTGSTVTRTESAVIDGTGVITGTYTMVEKPAGCAAINAGNIELQTGYTAERVMVFPAALSAQQITDIRSAM